MRAIFITFFIASFFLSLLSAQNKYYLNSYNNVLDVKVNGDDLWAGTTKGLVSFNKNTGEVCGIYNASNSPIPTDNVFDVEIGPDGAVWVATQEGVFRFNGFGFQVIASGLFTKLGFDDVGNMYAATKLEYEFCNVGQALWQFQSQNGFITSVAYNTDGYCYIHKNNVVCGGGGQNNGCGVFNFRDETVSNGEFTEVDNVDFKDILLIDSIGNFWSTLDKLSYVDPSTGVIVSPQTDTLSPGNPWQLKFNAAVQDSMGRLWLASSLGVFRFDGQNFVKFGEGLLSTGNVSSIDIDETGALFIGSRSGGVYRLNSSNDWEPWLVEGLISNGIYRMSSNTFDKYAFGSALGVSIVENDTIETHTILNSILPAYLPYCKVYVDETAGVWVNANDSIEEVYYLSGGNWSMFDSANSDLLSDDFEFIESSDQGEVWIRYGAPSIGAAGAKFQNGNFTNYMSIDSLYNETLMVENLWNIEGFAAVKDDDVTIESYPIPENMFDSTCVIASAINADGTGIISIENTICGEDIGTRLLVFRNTEWEVVDETFGLWDIGQIEFRGDDICISVSPAWYNCSPSHYKIIKPNNQIESYYLPEPASLAPNSGPVRDGYVYTSIDGAGDLWARYVSYYGNECWGPFTGPISSRVQLFKKTNAGFVRYAGPHCISAYPRSMNTIVNDGNDRIWIQGALGIYSTEPISPMLTIFEKNSDCAASITACVTSGLQGDFQFEWSDGNTDPLRFSIDAGDYSCTITDAGGTTNEANVTLDTGDAIVIESSFEYESTSGASDGSISIDTVIGTYPPFEYLWNTGDTTAQVVGLSPSVYEVTITDQIGCSNFAFFPLYEELQLTSTQSNVDCNGNDNGTIALIINGGLPPYEIDWQGSFSGDSLSGLSPGDYSVTVSDNTVYLEELTITITEPDSYNLIYGIEIQPEITPGEVEAIVDFNAGNPPYDILWSNGDSTEMLSGVAPGLYSVSITDANGCFESMDVWLYYPLIVESFLTDSVCSGDASGWIELSVSRGIPPYNFNWDFTNVDSSFVDMLTFGDYSVEINDSHEATIDVGLSIAEKKLSGNIFLTVIPSPLAYFLEVDFIDQGTAPYTYEWSTGDTTATIETFNNGIFYVTVTDAEDCTFQDEHILLTVDTNEPEQASSIHVFPNPTSSILHIQCKTCQEFELLNVDGKQITTNIEIGVGGIYELEMASLPAGVYVLKIFDENRKLLKAERVLLFR